MRIGGRFLNNNRIYSGHRIWSAAAELFEANSAAFLKASCVPVRASSNNDELSSPVISMYAFAPEQRIGNSRAKLHGLVNSAILLF
jgi:hypothetical protein